jgi:hypothetical protein
MILLIWGELQWLKLNILPIQLLYLGDVEVYQIIFRLFLSVIYIGDVLKLFIMKSNICHSCQPNSTTDYHKVAINVTSIREHSYQPYFPFTVTFP